MPDHQTPAPDNTAVRTALWRALHVLADPPPHVFGDTVGLKLASSEDGWRERPDMSAFTRLFCTSIPARARFIEDLVEEQAAHGVDQYVVLGAGLDTFAQRHPELASHMRVFEIDQPSPLAWKRQRLIDPGFGIPPHLELVPVDFEAGFRVARHVSAAMLAERYFANRADGLRPPNNSEELLVATA